MTNTPPHRSSFIFIGKFGFSPLESSFWLEEVHMRPHNKSPFMFETHNQHSLICALLSFPLDDEKEKQQQLCLWNSMAPIRVQSN